MDIKTLTQTHAVYQANIKNWVFWDMAYEGGDAFIENVLHRHTRETRSNWMERQREGMNFNHCQSIVNLFNFYLTEKAPIREMGRLKTDLCWEKFNEDSDLVGTNFSVMLNEAQKIASVLGSLGVLVNKAGHSGMTKADEARENVYPYCSLYRLQAIYDWKFQKELVTHRNKLVYLKLKEADDDDGNQVFTIWHPDSWEMWSVSQKISGKGDLKPFLRAKGDNQLGSIPFLWLPNIRKLGNHLIGISDIVEISRIMASIVRNISCGEEVIKFAGFPMMRKPMRREEDDGQEDYSGVTAIQEFDPEHGEGGKPDWMEPKIHRSIEAVKSWINLKTDETYRIAHLSGVHGQKTSNMMSTGVALRYEFQQLNSVLSQKSDNLSEAEMQIINLWLKWQKQEEYMKDIKVKRSHNFSIDDLTMSLSNSFEAINNVASETFIVRMQQQVAKQLLPDLDEDDFKQIAQELVDNVEIVKDDYKYNTFKYKKEAKRTKYSDHTGNVQEDPASHKGTKFKHPDSPSEAVDN